MLQAGEGRRYRSSGRRYKHVTAGVWGGGCLQAAQNIDTGMGLERVAQILQGVPNNYETDLLFPLVEEAARLAGIDYSSADERTKSSLKVIADHTRACVYLISDGVTPSNVGRGYILRRLIRRVVLKVMHVSYCISLGRLEAQLLFPFRFPS